MKSFSQLSTVFVLLMLIVCGVANAQISVDQASSAIEVEDLVEDVLLGACVTVSNVNYIGPSSAAGTFDASGTTFTMQNGILLTTGSANTAIGPDDDNNAGVDQGRPGDADLTVLATENTYDAVILEFDFVPQDDTLTFRYVFASEEYPEWVNSEYNDVFGFFISGPGISGPYVGGAANIALIPGTTTPVAINNVNNGYSANEPANGPCENCAYYVENGSGTAVQYDGYTTILTARAIVSPCETYHIRLAIADAGDHIYDSGVFLEAGSFTAGGGITVDFTNAGIEEGCSDEYVVFSRVNQANNSTAISATYSIGGTATMGADYNTFPTVVTIPAGQDTVMIPITVPLDFTVEGTETIIVYMDQPPCDCLAPGSATINVIDNDVPLALTTTGETTICLGQSANLTASVSGSLPPYTGSWNNGAPAGANVTVSPTTTTTYTYTVTDACNSQTQTSTETVTVIRPDFNANDQNQCLDGNSFSFANTGASGGSVSHYWTFGDGNSSTAENPTHTYLADGDFTVTHYVIYTASNCTASASALMTVYPEPTVSVSVDANVICSGGTDGALSASASGGTAGYSYSWSPGLATTPSISGIGVGTYTVTVTDANGCTDSDAGTVGQNDPTPPTITCPPTATINTDAGLCTSSASIGTATSSDNCGVASTLVDNAGPYSVGTTSVTWTATDVHGNTATCTQDVVVTDNENPTVTCPPTANISTNAGLCTSSTSIGTATFSDNCGVASTLADNAGPYSVGTTTVTWTATDVNGNTATCTQDVVVTDDENPSVTCPATANISTDAGLCTSSASIGTTTSSDNCGVASTLVDNAGPYSVGTTTVTWTVTDVNGNTATCMQDVVVTDNENPSVSCPPTANISTDAGLCTSSASIGTATSSDNCGVASTLVDNAWPYSVGTTTVTWTATDVNGNIATCTQDVVVTDDENPSVTCPPTANINTDAGLCTSSSSIGTATSSDNCGVASTLVDNSGPYSVGTTTVTWTATDVNGNIATCTQDVMVTDNENPSVTCPPTANINTDAGLCTSSASVGTATSSDNCGVASTLIDNAGPYSVGTTTVTWTATDVNGNSATCTQDVVVTDDENPSVTCPATANISTDAGLCTSSASIGTATSSDNCGVASTLVDNAGPYSVGTTTVTWTATDVNGNIATCTQDVIVTDNENPSVTCPPTANISTDAGLCSSSASIGTATSSDNCGVASTLVDNAGPYSVGTTTVTWTATDVNGNVATCTQDVVVTDNENPSVTCPPTANISTDAGLCTSSASIGTATSSDNCGIASTLVDNSGPYSVGTTTVTWTATDVNGNSATCTQDVVVTDDENPSVTCPPTANINTDAGLCTSSASIGTATSSDNCGIASTLVDNSGPYSVGTTTVTWTATDVNGNISTCTQDVVVTDDENPSVTCPATANISTDAGLCTSSASIGTATSSDNCGVASTLVDNNGPYSVGTTTVTWTATDVNGNTATCTQDVVVTDDENPTITCPPTANTSTDPEVCTSSASIGVPTTNDNCGVASTVVDNAGPYSVGTTTVTWTVSDANGNTATCSQDVVVTDDEDPIIYGCPSDISITPSSSDCSPVVTWNIPQAEDNCSATLSSTHNSGDSFPVGTTTVTYTATDPSGNTYDCSFDVTITPSALVLTITPSTVVCGANITCNGATDGTATANVSGGCLPYTYDWSNGQTGQTATDLAAGTYTVIVTDANGSTQTESITLTEPDALEIDGYEISEYVGGTGVSCNGASDGDIDVVIIGGSTCEPYDISWTGPNGFTSSSQNLTGLEAGTYTVTIEDVNGCTTTGTYTITEPDAFDPTCTSEDALCNGDANGSVEVSVTGGTAPYSYSWSNGSSNASQTGLTAGTYAVTITDANGCTTSCNSVVDEPNVLTAVVTAFDETLVNGCNGSAIATPTGGTPPYSYDWSDGQTDSTAIDLCADTYTVTVTDANGCTFTTSVVINPPTCDLDVDMSATNVSCNGGSDGTATATPLTLQNNTPFTYSWNNGGSTQTLTGLTAGPYTVVVTDSIGCEASGSVTVSEPPALSVSTTVVDEQTFNGCDGSATANPSGGTPPYTYSWNDSQNQSAQTASDLCPGTYTVTVTDANGCDETVTITVNPLLCTGFSVAVNTESLSCFEAGDGSATAVVTGGTSPFTYFWSNGGATPTISGLASGTYTVTVTDAVNCSQTVSGNVSQPALLEAATAVDNVSCHGIGNGVVELTVTGGTPDYTFAWNNGATTEDLNNVGPGSYDVLVTDENGCTTTASATVTELDTLGASSIDVQVSCNEGNNGSIDLEPTGGLPPYLYDWSNGETTQDISGLSAGTYTVTFADQNGCLFTYETTISEPNLLVATCSAEDALCNGDANGSVSVSVTGGTEPYSYSWSNGSTDASQSGLTAGTYVVTVTDANGCTATCNAAVGEPNILTAVVDVQDETIVNGCNGSATANPTGGTPPYSYEWSNGETTQTITDLCAGTYTVIVTDANECEYTTSNIVNPPSCDLDVDMSSTDVDCNGSETGTATATPITLQNNTPFTYLWNNGATTQTLSGVSAGPYSVVVTDSIGCEASGSVVISEPTALSVSTVVVDEQNFGACDGSATATASGGTPPYSYEWSDGQTTATASDLCPGTYTVTVTDANGCEETVTITVNPLLCTGFSVAINTESLSCFEAGDGSATAVVTGGTAPFTYSWSNGETTPTISGLAAGQYTVTVTDAVNCSQTVSGNVSQPALLEAATAVDNVSCHGIGNGVVELTVTGGTPDYTFAWDNGATTEDLNNVGPGTYNVLVTDENGCTVTASAVVTEPDTMQVSSVDVNPTCLEGSDGSIDLTITGGLGPYLVAWDSGQNTADISGLTAGTYVATIVDQNGCIYTYSTTLTDPPQVTPTITADGPTIFCEGDSVTLTSSEASSYFWSPNGETTQSITVYDAGSYSVSVVTEDGCEGTSASTTVSIFQVDPAVIDVSGPTEFCQGGSVTLYASQGSSFVWMPNGETTSSITVSTSGTYSVTVTDANGCESVSDDVTVTVFDLPTPTVTADGPLMFCDGGSVTLTSSAAESYGWAPFGQTTQSLTVTESGIYRVTVTDANGCQGTSDPIQVIVNDLPEPVITADGPTEFCEGGSVMLTGPAGLVYSWLPNGETSQSITVTESGNYQLMVTDENGCVGESNIITVTEFDVDTATVTAQGATEFCDGGEVTLVASSGVSYEWSPNGETTQTILVTESGFYSVTVVDQNGCETTSDAVEVIVNPLPDATITANGPLEFCEGDSVVLSAPAGFTYNWAPNGETTQSITVYTTGTFLVTVLDQNECSATSVPVSTTMFEQEEVEISANGATEFCEGGQVVLAASTGSSFQWSPNGEVSQSITVTESGVYTVYVTDENGCGYPSADTVEVVVNPNPVPVVTPDGSTEFCDGDSVVLTSSAAESYMWAPFGQNTQSITVTASGIYRVTVTDENGCQGTSAPTMITVFELPQPEITADGPLTICPEDSVVLTSSSAVSYSWSPNGEITQSITVHDPGTYSVTVIDGNGCEGTATEPVIVEEFEVEPATITASGITEFCLGDDVTLTANGGSSYEWEPNGEQSQDITVSESGTYTVTVIDANGCSSTSDDVEVTVFDLPEPTLSLSGSSAICEGDSVTITVSAGEAYLWSPAGETTQSITVYEAGLYWAEVADANTCVGVSDTIEITVFETTQIDIVASGSTEFCDGGEVVLSATGGQSYNWLPNGEQTSSIIVSESGEYTVEVVDLNGCASDVDTVVVDVYDLPTVSADIIGSLEVCEGDSAQLTATSNSDVTYQWFEGGSLLNGETNADLFVTDASSYSVVVTDTNGCTATDDAPIITLGPVPVAVITGDNAACLGGSITLVASGGDNYLWSNGSESASITVPADSATVYTVSVTNEFCSQVSTDSVETMVYSLPDANIETLYNGFLEVDHLFAETSGDASIVYWSWDFGDGEFGEEQSLDHTYSDEGFFAIIVTTENEFGCLGYDTAEVEITQVIDIPNVFTPNNDGYNDHLFIGNFGVDNYELTIYNRWGIVMHHDDTGEIFWDGKTPAGVDAEAGSYFYVLDVINQHSEGSFKQTGYITLIR